MVKEMKERHHFTLYIYINIYIYIHTYLQHGTIISLPLPVFLSCFLLFLCSLSFIFIPCSPSLSISFDPTVFIETCMLRIESLFDLEKFQCFFFFTSCLGGKPSFWVKYRSETALNEAARRCFQKIHCINHSQVAVVEKIMLKFNLGRKNESSLQFWCVSGASISRFPYFFTAP